MPDAYLKPEFQPTTPTAMAYRLPSGKMYSIASVDMLDKYVSAGRAGQTVSLLSQVLDAS